MRPGGDACASVSWRMTEPAPETANTFADLPLNPALFQGLDAVGHVRMTPIQAQALPAVL